MNIVLKDFQMQAVSKLNNAMDEDKKNIILESGTGSGKTIILTHFINEYMKLNNNYVTVWFCPGKGNLEEQSKEKMDKYIPTASTKVLQDILNIGFFEGDTVFVNWELVTKKGNKALADGEYNNLIDRIEIAKDKGIKFLVIIDEEHLNKTIKSHDIIELFAPEKIIRASATPQKDKVAIHIQVPDEEIIKAGLVKRRLIINEDMGYNIELSNQVSYLLDLGIKKQKHLKEAFVKENIGVNPLIIIQIPNKSESLVDDIEEYLETRGINYNNNQLAIWLSEKKENLEFIEKNDSPVKAIIIKQAIATGWDCPRAYILVKLRENMSETFEIQTIGRIRRMPEAKHYNNNLLDSCYLYTFDEKYKEGVRNHLGYGALDACTLFLKEEYQNVKLIKEKIPYLQYESNPSSALKAFEEFIKQEFNVKKLKFDENIIAFRSYGYSFDKKVNMKTYKGELSTIHRKDILHLNEVKIKMLLDTHEHGRMFHQSVSRLGRSVGLSYDSMSIIIRRLFCKAPLYKGKVLNLELKELYAFVINNFDLLEKSLKKAISNEKYSNVQLAFVNNSSKETFIIPKQVTFTYNSTIKDFDLYDKNVYRNYTSLAAPRSQGEKIFEGYCQQASFIDWFYKNGDKGDEFFSIVYSDNAAKKHHFYPDYVVSINDEIWIIEVKGGESEAGISEDIDIYSEKKFEALLNYCKNYNLHGGFVRYNKSDMKLYINTVKYAEHIDDDNWKRIDRFFK